uniref:Uncharacterized protein n=1 Tax=Oryza nivara TaxID=4536 RepID=A0A0E0HRP9_ORYNI
MKGGDAEKLTIFPCSPCPPCPSGELSSSLLALPLGGRRRTEAARCCIQPVVNMHPLASRMVDTKEPKMEDTVEHGSSEEDRKRSRGKGDRRARAKKTLCVVDHGGGEQKQRKRDRCGTAGEETNLELLTVTVTVTGGGDMLIGDSAYVLTDDPPHRRSVDGGITAGAFLRPVGALHRQAQHASTHGHGDFLVPSRRQKIDFPRPMAYSYVACWKRIVIRDGSPCKVVLFPSAMVSIQQVLSQLMKSDNASTPASGKNTYMVADGRIYRCALQRVDSNDS